MSIWNVRSDSNRGNNEGKSIGTGFDVTKSTGVSDVKGFLKKALTLSASDAKESTILHYAEEAGKIGGFNSMLGMASKMKLEASKRAIKTQQILMNHANAAAKTELSYQTNTAKSLESMSDTLLKLGVEQEKHQGFASYNDKADRLMNW